MVEVTRETVLIQSKEFQLVPVQAHLRLITDRDSSNYSSTATGRMQSFPQRRWRPTTLSTLDTMGDPFDDWNDEVERTDKRVFLVLCTILVVLSIALVVLVILLVRRRRREGVLEAESPKEVTQDRIDRRYETVEGWLVTKRALPHDEACMTCREILRRAESSSSDEEDSSSSDPDENESSSEKECPICMEPFELDDIVSWGTNSDCQHAFHHECIKEWTLRRTDCPCCRQTLLAVDVEDGDRQDMSVQHSRRNATTYYCLHEGLVAVPPILRCTRPELETLRARICDTVIRRKELACLRGGRQERSIPYASDEEAAV